MVDYCAVEYINTTLKMKIRMIDYKGQKLSKVQEKGQGKKKKTKKVPLFTKNNTNNNFFFFYEKKKDI